ncbi:hypothetical protein LMG27174_00033 [Paraburkholderia rhynchosiae]|uniref:DUF5666 domain-containing protein n=2 Tax=Paraburkholderia rhynchosiae TaxID=487049 RepID=A0A2N7WXR3_9BURK|nr:hypothetical protein C0Z16_00175 [Paraburkholderia rhynchosiae]CAB3636037.1 hypothetical protein LMG27174_00033 [Paraburkholderia rhynchosiae]
MRAFTLRSSTMLHLAFAGTILLGHSPTGHAQEVRAPASASAPGAEVVARLTSRIVNVDPQTSRITVQGSRGETVVVDVDPEVGDVRLLKVGDEVHVEYKGALLLSAEKVDTKGVRSRVEGEATTPITNGASVKLRDVEVVATVQSLDRKKRQIVLRGPVRSVLLQIAPDVPLDKIAVGDSVRASYRAETALVITRDGKRIR